MSIAIGVDTFSIYKYTPLALANVTRVNCLRSPFQINSIRFIIFDKQMHLVFLEYNKVALMNYSFHHKSMVHTKSKYHTYRITYNVFTITISLIFLLNVTILRFCITMQQNLWFKRDYKLCNLQCIQKMLISHTHKAKLLKTF